MKCPNCAVEVPGGAAFCHECGAKVSGGPEPGRFAALADTPMFRDPDKSSELGVISQGSEVQIEGEAGDFWHIRLASGERGYVSKAAGAQVEGTGPIARGAGTARRSSPSAGISPPAAASTGSRFPGAVLVARALFFVGWAALILGILGAIGVAVAYDCQDSFLTDCSDEGTTRAVYFFTIAIGSILYALPTFALSYTLKYLADLERRGT